MKHLDEVLTSHGLRKTEVRVSLLDILDKSPEPMTAPALHAALIMRGITANKSTVYRDIERFMSEEIIDEVDLGEGQKRYERATTPHHHAMCLACNRITHIELPSHLAAEERLLATQYGFFVKSHALDFFGTCASCQRTQK